MAPPSPDGFTEIEDIFAAALAAGDAARTQVLDMRCAGRLDVRAEVESLLAAHADAAHFITSPALAAGGGPEAPLAEVTPGMRLGAFRLLDRIATGGMGEVFRAERVEADFSQTVAIKVIAGRLVGADTLRRFRTERQILAALQHPNIVALLDGGLTEAEQPFIVMELVNGVPLAEFCRRRELSLQARLALFRQLCAAVQFAHRHLVVHRDLKPANVLVTPEGTVKVLDFGIAKLLDPRQGGSPGTMPLMAPITTNYASPEQLRGLPATTACDVYALGVMLYELLAGKRPYETAGRTVDEVIDIVLHRDPIRPSAIRSGRVPYSPRALAGDLDAIVQKAMQKEPGARYASAAELSEDIFRFLAGAPVVARGTSVGYLARKTIARHRTEFTVAAVAFVLLVTALVGAVWQAKIAARERERAVQRFNDVRELAGALIFRIHDQVAALPGSTPVRRTVVAEGLRFLERLERESTGEPRLQVDLAKAYVRLGDVQGRRGAANLGDREGARRSYQRAIALGTEALTAPETAPDALATVAQANLELAMTVDGGESLAAVRRAHELASEWCRRQPDNVRAAGLFARASFFLALRTPHAAARPRWEAVDRLYKGLLARDSGNPEHLRNVALTQKYLGSHFEQAGELRRALAHFNEALVLDRKRLAAAPGDRSVLLDVAISLGSVASTHRLLGEHAQAIAGFRESLELRQGLSEADPGDVFARSRVAWMHMSLAWAYEDLGQFRPARQHLSEGMRLNATLPANEPPYRLERGHALATLARFERAEGRLARACALDAEALRHLQAGGTLLPRDVEAMDRVRATLKQCAR